MQQEILVKASNDMIVKGIKDFCDILYHQTDMKPEEYLPIVVYLNIYAKSLKANKEPEQSSVEKQETKVLCNNSAIVTAIEKSKKLLYKQTSIQPEVYLKIFEKMDEYAQILKDQDAGKIIPGPKEPEEKKPEKQEQNQIATKNEGQNLEKVKGFFD